MGVGYSLDVSKIDVCFGGFSPMALSDSVSSREQVLAAEQRAQLRRESLDRAAALKSARLSARRECNDGLGTCFSYVVLDEAEVQIESCSTDCACLVIPAFIEGKPVVSLGTHACAKLSSVREIECPDSIVSIGSCAFRDDPALEKLILPKSLAEFNSEWFRASPRIKHLTLPGQLARLSSRIFDTPNLKVLAIGAGTSEIMPGSFEKSKLEHISIDGDNPFLMTDGKAIYSRDGAILAALAVPVDEYKIHDGCIAVAGKGFSSFKRVKSIDIPDSLEVIGEFAFSRTSISSFKAPDSLRHIMRKAFFHCADLEEVCLGEGLLSVHENAFSGTSIHELHLPSSVEELGTPIAANTQLIYSGADATFSIAEGSAYLDLDEDGGLYHEEDSGKHLICMMNPELVSYAVKDGTVAIGERAFANHACLQEISFPDSLVEVRRAAFKACHELVQVYFSDGVTTIAKEAFLDTNIKRLRLPDMLETLGENALVSYGAHHGATEPSLREVYVSEKNEHFFTESGLLLERKPKGKARVLVCTGGCELVRIPKEVDEIAPYAFNDARGIHELYLSDRIRNIGIRGLAVHERIEHIHIDLCEPISGHESFDIYFPDTDRGAQQMMLALSVPDHINPAVIFEHYDNAIVNASSFDAERNEGLSVYEQATRLLDRLLDPVFLTSPNRSMCDHVLKTNIKAICIQVAKHDDRRTIDKLLDLGYLNGENINYIIDSIAVVQDAAMTGYLLEAKRLRFKEDSIDFDL